MAKILIIDDEASILESLDMFLSEKNHDVYQAETGSEGLALFRKYEPEVVILDIRLPDINGLDLLCRLQEEGVPCKIIMITAFYDMETTIQAMKNGAYDYINKPLDADEIETAIHRAIQILKVDRETPLAKDMAKPPNPEVIIGRSKQMRGIFKTIGLLCQNRATVLIQGATGTGKELVARVIHRNSLYSEEPFITLDCSSVVETLLESELFGHEKGAFTGASHAHKGKIELAGSGTLFLDEIGELPPSIQGKLLGFLQRREYMRVGGQVLLKSLCRVIAATNRELQEMVRRRLFREDLFYRLRVVTIRVPPLNERLSDLEDLVRHFLQKINFELGTNVTKLQGGVLKRLQTHPWTGNVRELENVLVEAVVRAKGKVLLLEEIDKILNQGNELPEAGLNSFSLPHMEKQHIYDILMKTGWNRTEAAKWLGISLPTLRSKIRKYGLDPSQVK